MQISYSLIEMTGVSRIAKKTVLCFVSKLKTARCVRELQALASDSRQS